jgi:hypothetical protein
MTQKMVREGADDLMQVQMDVLGMQEGFYQEVFLVTKRDGV